MPEIKAYWKLQVSKHPLCSIVGASPRGSNADFQLLFAIIGAPDVIDRWSLVHRDASRDPNSRFDYNS